MRILIFGRVGQLGSALAELLSAGHQLKFLDQPEIDLAQTNSISRHISRSGADLVINAAAYTAVDKAQSESELAQRINADAPAAMAKACHTLGVPFIHFSRSFLIRKSSSLITVTVQSANAGLVPATFTILPI